MKFDHHTLGQRVRFGAGEAAVALADEVGEASAPMIIVAAQERGLAEELAAGLPIALWHDEVVMHVPTDVADRARRAATEAGADLVISIGGGSTTGLAKAVALTTGLPIVAIPTTYAGSEATNVWGLTEAGTKTTGVDDRVLPRTVIYDANLTLSLPVQLSVASGLNALAHCVDSMWAPRADPINAALAVAGIRALTLGLPAVVDDPAGLPGREQTLSGAYLAAVAFASAGSGLHHKICHVLGGMFDLPHAQTHAVILPQVLAFNASAAPEAERRLAAAFGSADAIAGLAQLRERLAAPSALRDYQMPRDGIPAAAAAIVAAAPPGNPREVTVENIAKLLEAAWEGVLR